MDLLKDHVLLSRGGRVGLDGVSAVPDVERIGAQACAGGKPNGIVMHFHGGLVNEAAGLDIARRLEPMYTSADTYPIFFVWQSGLIESIRNNLHDILHDAVFQELTKKVGEWALKKMGGTLTTRGGGGAVLDEDQFRRTFDDWFSGRAAEPPVPMDAGAVGTTKTRAVEPSEDDLASEIEVELPLDVRFESVMAGLYASRRGADGVVMRGGGVPAADVSGELVDQRAIDELFPSVPGTTRGVLEWYRVARFVAKLTIRVIRRHLNDRDHGAYTTIVEEVLRGVYLDRVGEVVWRTMKKDTADAFGGDGSCVGTLLLQSLARACSAAGNTPTITLVGHSTGAVYINHFLAHAASAMPDAKFRIVLLAPACRFDDFCAVLQQHEGRIAHFRVFAMKDELEIEDRLVPIIYPRSLLYFVSGLLEGEPDVPILGMQRFLTASSIFSKAAFPYVDEVRQWLDGLMTRAVWSIDERLDGLGSACRKHGDFDNDPATLDSLKWIVQKGF